MKTSSLLTLSVLAVLASCAKEKKYEEIFKVNVIEKSLISTDPKDPYIYVPSVENTPMNVTASRPYWMGEQKLVTFKFEENELQVLQLPNEPRFAANPNNFSPVFKLDIEHKDYRCKKDQYNECSNVEEEIDDRPWNQKQFFKADFAKLATLETNSLPEQLTNLFSRCFETKSTVVKNVQIEKDAINITVARTMNAGIECADVESFDDLRNISFTVNYNYSFVKRSKLASAGYEPVTYPGGDQNTFGFFTTERKKLNADNNSSQNSDVTYMNRWSPNRKEIVYYLNADFFKPEMRGILDGTKQAVETINASFQKAGVDLRIVLKNGSDKNVGDLRNNFIILVPDPQASGVIGYGPSITDPLTGEIVKAHTVMYYGTIRKFIEETYDELVQERQRELEASNSNLQAESESMLKEGKIGVDKEFQQKSQAQQISKEQLKNALAHLTHAHSSSDVHSRQPRRVQTDFTRLNERELKARLEKERFSHERVYKPAKFDDMIEEMSRQNLYHHSMFNFASAVNLSLEDNGIELADLKPWTALTEEEKEDIIKKILPYVWVPTLVHELGHNLGLRHNFNGSEDKANYYSPEERSALGIKRNVTYSSVMDYSRTSLNQLPIMGHYDIAALRFGYARKIELKDGSLAQVKGNLESMKPDGIEEKMREFRYCTDEHVAVNPGCKRFDDGSNLAEIAQSMIDQYEENYKKRSFRNNRTRFSSVDDASYYSRVKYTFHSLRIFFELFDRINGMYPNLTPDQWESIEFLKELKQATQLAANFFLRVLNTPDLHCIVVKKDSKELAGIVPLANLADEAISCFDEKNLQIDQEKYTIVAETGRPFNHIRSTDIRSDLKPDPSQISVRGIWIDKVLAMEYLFKRIMNISTFDDYRSSFVDYQIFREPIVQTLGLMLADKIQVASPVTNGKGEVVKLDEVIDREGEAGEPLILPIGDTHKITKSFSWSLNPRLGIKKPTTDLRELILPKLKETLADADNPRTTIGILNSLSVNEVSPLMTVDPRDIAKEVTLRDQSGVLTGRFAAIQDNSIALTMMNQREKRVVLEKVNRSQLIGMYIGLVSPEQTADPVPAEFAIVTEAALLDVFTFLTTGKLENAELLERLKALDKKVVTSIFVDRLIFGTDLATLNQYLATGSLEDKNLEKMLKVLRRNDVQEAFFNRLARTQDRSFMSAEIQAAYKQAPEDMLLYLQGEMMSDDKLQHLFGVMSLGFKRSSNNSNDSNE